VASQPQLMPWWVYTLNNYWYTDFQANSRQLSQPHSFSHIALTEEITLTLADILRHTLRHWLLHYYFRRHAFQLRPADIAPAGHTQLARPPPLADAASQPAALPAARPLSATRQSFSITAIDIFTDRAFIQRIIASRYASRLSRRQLILH